MENRVFCGNRTWRHEVPNFSVEFSKDINRILIPLSVRNSRMSHKILGNGNGNVHPRTGHEDPKGE
jgi:hypothetical protein